MQKVNHRFRSANRTHLNSYIHLWSPGTRHGTGHCIQVFVICEDLNVLCCSIFQHIMLIYRALHVLLMKSSSARGFVRLDLIWRTEIGYMTKNVMFLLKYIRHAIKCFFLLSQVDWSLSKACWVSWDVVLCNRIVCNHNHTYIHCIVGTVHCCNCTNDV